MTRRQMDVYFHARRAFLPWPSARIWTESLPYPGGPVRVSVRQRIADRVFRLDFVVGIHAFADLDARAAANRWARALALGHGGSLCLV